MTVFYRTGFKRSSMEQVAEAAGLTRQALYHHFKTKEALFQEVIEQLHQMGLDAGAVQADQREAAGGSLADVLCAEVITPLRLIADGLSGSPHTSELFSQHAAMGCDPHARFLELHAARRVAAIDRFRRERGVDLVPGMTPIELVRCIELSVNGVRAAYPTMQPASAFLREVELVVRTLVSGATRSKPARSPRRARSPRTQRREVP